MRRFTALCLATMAALSVGPVVSAQSVLAQSVLAQSAARTPLAAPIQLTGVSGGRESSTCGNIDRTAGQTVNVTETFASLSFEVESEGDYTLLITGPSGFRECVFAHNYDGGVIQAPGLLNQGQYRVYVGDRKGESHPYTLSISQ